MTKRKPATQRGKYDDQDRLLIVHGYFFPSIPSIAALHKGLVRGMIPFERKQCRVLGSGPGGCIPIDVRPSLMDNYVPMSIKEYLAQADAIIDKINADHMYLHSSIRFGVSCSPAAQHMDCEYPAEASVHILDDPAALGTKKYSLAEVARNAIIEMDRDGNCAHALVDYGLAYGYNNEGSIYSAFPLIPMSFDMWLDFVDWGTIGADQEHRVRRLCWGSYFGPRMAEKLGPTFIEEYLSRKYDYDGSSPQTAERLPGGGIYVTLTDRPQDVLDSEWFPDLFELPLIRNAAWLRQRLRRLHMI